jgi:hypothetical protein
MKRKSNRHANDALWNDGPSKGKLSVETRERKPPKNWYVVADQEEAALPNDADLMAWDIDDLMDES